MPQPGSPGFCPLWRASWGRCSRWSWGVCLKSQMESPEGGTGLHLLQAVVQRAEVMPEEGISQRPTVWGWKSQKGSLRSCNVSLDWCRWGNCGLRTEGVS